MNVPAFFRPAACSLILAIALANRAAAFEWQTGSPETAGLSTAKLDGFRAHLASHAIIAVRNGGALSGTEGYASARDRLFFQPLMEGVGVKAGAR